MVNRKYVFLLMLIFFSSAACASCKSFGEKILTSIFYEMDDLSSGQIAGLVIGSDKDKVFFALKKRSGSNIRQVPYLVVDGVKCKGALEKIPSSGGVIVFGKNRISYGSVHIKDNVVVRIDKVRDFEFDLAVGSSRDKLIGELGLFLDKYPEGAVESHLDCDRLCDVNLNDWLEVANRSDFLSAWRVQFPSRLVTNPNPLIY